MRARFFALAVGVAGISGCATDPSATPPGPLYEREIREGRPGLFGDLTWRYKPEVGLERANPAPAPAAAMSAAEQEEFKRWRESAGSSERQEFEEWRAWQEWKRKNPK